MYYVQYYVLKFKARSKKYKGGGLNKIYRKKWITREEKGSKSERKRVRKRDCEKNKK